MSRKHKDVVVSKLEETTSAEGEILEEEEEENVPKSKDGKGVKKSRNIRTSSKCTGNFFFFNQIYFGK